MEELGLTALELADAVNDLIAARSGQLGKFTDRDVRRLLAGQTRWPRHATRAALEIVLQCSAIELGFLPRSRSAMRVAQGVPFGERAGRPKEDLVNRREVLGVAAGTVLSITLPDLPKAGRLGMSDVARLRKPLNELFALDDRLGGVTLTSAAVRQAERVLAAAERYDVSDRVGAALYGLAGEFLAAGGWFAVDADDLDTAGDHLDRALRLATMARDSMLQAQVWNCLTMRARQARAFGEAHQIAKAGLESTAARRNPKIAALFHARVAHGHAYRGEAGMAERSLGRAQKALGRATADTATPGWLAFVNEAQLHALSAMAYNSLGRYPQGAEHAATDLQMVPAAFGRNRVHGQLHLVDALIGSREPEQAATEATEALRLAGTLNGALHAGRVAARLRRVREGLARWPQEPAARRWLDLYDATVALA
jgi:hypothetical protein